MKIAIQGHPTRGKEIIQILESLGGENKNGLYGDGTLVYYFINKDKNISFFAKGIIADDYQCYTLEEFETKFPFKIGDKVRDCSDNEIGIIVDLLYIDNAFIYNVDFVYSGQAFMLTKELKPYKEMKKERNITLTLDKAKEWYKQGGDLKEVALQAFSEKELNPLPKSWEEYCKGYKVPAMIFGPCIPNKYVALWKLEQLRDCYRQGWKPDWANTCANKYCIVRSSDELIIFPRLIANTFLTFQSREIAEEFLKNFKSLIKEAYDLI